MRIIPAIDILNGKCVRLTKGDFNTQIVYNNDPVEVAKEFENNGIEYVHLVDLDGAKSKHIVNHETLYNIANKTKLKVDFGGGIKSTEDVKIAFENGASQITAGSIALENKDLFLSWLEEYGAEKIILGADAKKRKIATQGWLKHSNVDIIDFIAEYEKSNINYVICTDIEKDGMLKGASNNLYKEIVAKTSVKLIASGGISGVKDILKLKEIGCFGAIVGKAFYEGKINLMELKSLC